MLKKYSIIGLCILLTGAVIFGGYKVWMTVGQKDADSALFVQLKKYCHITEVTPFENRTLGFRLEFSDDAIVCDYQPVVQEGGGREVYIWNKEAFNKPTQLGFGLGIIGKVTMNPLPGLPAGVTIAEEAGTIAGISTTIKTVRPPSCITSECPTSRIVELLYRGDAYVLEEYATDVRLFDSFTFLPR